MRHYLKSHWIAWVILLYLTIGIVTFAQSSPMIQVRSIDFSPDGSRIALVTDIAIEIYDQDFNLIQTSPQDPDYPRFVYQWYPDNQRLVINNQIYDSSTLLPISDVGVFNRWSSDGTLMFGRAPEDFSDILIYNPMTDEVVSRIYVGNFLESLSWSPDNTRFLAAGGSELIVLGVEQGGITARYSIDGTTSIAVWSPDSQQFAVAVTEKVSPNTPGSRPIAGESVIYGIYIIDAETGTIIQRLRPLDAPTRTLYWTPVGNRLIAIVGVNKIQVWDTSIYQLIDTFTSNTAIAHSALSPTGGRLLYEADKTTPIPQTERTTLQSSPGTAPGASYLDGLIQSVVPAPSFNLLAAIQAKCVTHNEIDITQVRMDMGSYIEHIENLPGGAITPSCATDLISVAQALQALGE